MNIMNRRGGNKNNSASKRNTRGNRRSMDMNSIGGRENKPKPMRTTL
jgi:hypothetical protein